MEQENLVSSQIISVSFYRTLYYNKDIYDLTDTHLTPKSWRPTAQLQLSAGACAEERAEERTQSSSLRKRSSTHTFTHKLPHEVKNTSYTQIQPSSTTHPNISSQKLLFLHRKLFFLYYSGKRMSVRLIWKRFHTLQNLIRDSPVFLFRVSLSERTTPKYPVT